MSSTTKRFTRRAAIVAAVTMVLGGATAVSAQAYDVSPDVVYQLGSDPCLKGTGNCVIYPKSTQLPSGRLLVAFEKSTIPASGTAVGQTVPVMKSDDDGTTWQPLADVPAPAYLSEDPAVQKYTSNWTNPYLYVLPESIGSLAAGTILLATVVSGEDEYFVEKKAADPNWIPSNDGDRRDLALALYASTDEGENWSFVNIIAEGGWQGGSAGNIGTAISAANTNRQFDPLWEPHLDVHDGKLVAYYSDENDYVGFDAETGAAILDPDNDTATDSGNQILVHRTWDGSGAGWGETIVDVAGGTSNMGGGKTVIGAGRPGMATLARTTDDKWLYTFEYFGGGSNVRYKLSDDPLDFNDGDNDGQEITALPLTNGSRALARGGSPVLYRLPDGRIAYNAAGSGNIWVNTSGRSDGAWTEYQTTIGSGYSRTMQYVEDTGRVVIFQGTWGGATAGSVIRRAEVDLGGSVGTYYSLVNKKTGQVLGTGGNTTDANIGNGNQPDIRLEAAGAASNGDTQLWRLQEKADGTIALLNKSGGRAATVWTGNATAGQRIAQWVDERDLGAWRIVQNDDGSQRLQSATNASLFLTGTAADQPATLQAAATDGSQDWTLVGTDSDAEEQTIQVTVPSTGDGEFSWRIDGSNGIVDLGTATNEGDHFLAEGAINPILVTDTRRGGPVWSVSAQVGEFTSGGERFSGKYLGWTPQLIEDGAGAIAGSAVESGFDGGNGLSVSQTLGHAPGAHELGSAKLGADLELKLPVDVVDGTYQATLTLTALS